MKISLIQAKLKLGQVDENFKIIEEKIRIAKEDKTDLVLLPEMWNTSFLPKNIKDLADKKGERTQEFLSLLSKELKINIVGGSVARLEEDKIFNTTYVYNKQGSQIGTYDKVHLFTPAEEEKIFTYGRKTNYFEIDGIKCGSMTCYDIRFTEWVRKYALDGVKILFVPAAWAKKRLDHWNILNRARAIENQIFVACVNPAGVFGGNSALIDPWGQYILKMQDQDQVATGQINLDVIEEIRTSINVFKDRRQDLY